MGSWRTVNEASIPWARVERRLRNAEIYWLASTRPDGRPHCVPIWGVWGAGCLWFWTDRSTVKARNLATDPRASVHLESGDDVVILDGEVERVLDSDGAAQRLAAYADKYPDFDLESERLGDPYRFRPRIAHAWLEALLPDGRARWEPPPSG
jgi:PPOX class probable F420-dependent enzyme